MKPNNIRWRRILAEGGLIVISVLVAISLESAWQAHQNRLNARASLVEVLNELEADKTFLLKVISSQENLSSSSQFILGWLENPDMTKLDSLDNAFREFDTPLSMWPRNYAWTSMVSANQISLLNDKQLVLNLGEHYQFFQERVVESSRQYDQEFSRLQFESIPQFRNLDIKSAQALQPDDYRVFRNQVLRLTEWNNWYIDLLSEYESHLDMVTESVKTYLSD